MNYQRSDIIIAFHFRNPDDLDPSEAQLESADDALFEEFDQHLRKEAPRAGIDLNPINLSRLAVLAAMSNGAPVTQARRACQYFKAVDGATSILLAGPEVVVEVPIAAAAPATRSARKAPAKRTPAKRRGSRG